MEKFTWILAIISFIPIASVHSMTSQNSSFHASCQGRIQSVQPDGCISSPNGKISMETNYRAKKNGLFEADPILYAEDGVVCRPGIFEGDGFLLSDRGFLAVIKAPDSNRTVTDIRIFNMDGDLLTVICDYGITQATFNNSGNFFLYRLSNEVIAIDPASGIEQRYPYFEMFDMDENGLFAGIRLEPEPTLEIMMNSNNIATYFFDNAPRKIQFNHSGDRLYVLKVDELMCYNFQLKTWSVVFSSSMNGELRDMAALEDQIILGRRFIENGISSGELIVISYQNSWVEFETGEKREVISNICTENDRDGIPWPMELNAQHPVGNTYGAYQEFPPYEPYLHPGIDIREPALTPVYAVKEGFVKAILTTSAEYHWRVAIGESDSSAFTEGYLYAHLAESTIAVDEGDWVTQGQYLGDIIEWPIYDYHHLHFTQIGSDGEYWNGYWFSVGNPQIQFTNQSETTPPVIADALPNSKFAFCANETSDYIDSNNLHGPVDIIVLTYDEIEMDLDCTVQEIRYSIYPENNPSTKIVENLQSIYFNMDLDTYRGGDHDSEILPIFYKLDSVCETHFEYEVRDYYHIITNSNGDQVYDQQDAQACWDTTVSPDGNYVIEVSVWDAAGNLTVETMIVSVNNGDVPTPSPTPTPTAIPELGVRIGAPDWAHPGDPFYVDGFLDNPGTFLSDIPVLFILQVDNGYWFWPDWTHYEPPENSELDWQRMDVKKGTTFIRVLPALSWPETGDISMSGLRVYGAMLNPDMSAIIGNSAMHEWGFGP